MSDEPGDKTKFGGRPKGAKNKATVEKEALVKEALEAVKKDGRSPLETILSVMRGGRHARGISDRMYAAAIAAAPYVHPRLAAVQHSGGIAVDPGELSDAQLAAIAAGSSIGATEAEGGTGLLN